MNRNLDVYTFRNGDSIYQAQSNEEWERCSNDKIPAWSYYKYPTNPHHAEGKLYNWYAVNDPRGIAPKGWHVPAMEEWNAFIESLGGPSEAFNSLRAIDYWEREGATNASKFNAVPSGFRADYGSYMWNNASYWSSTEDTIYKDKVRIGFLSDHKDQFINQSIPRGCGASVRCVSDN